MEPNNKTILDINSKQRILVSKDDYSDGLFIICSDTFNGIPNRGFMTHLSKEEALILGETLIKYSK